ncbi:hypothetical protein EV426DRAFT_592665 [Tirmania nivea]|nr:hypothetical protein EV426DRAFT_592665 [Tirmania nivea]
MRFLWSSVLALLLLLTPALTANFSGHDGPISSCIWGCLSTYALNDNIFTCYTLKINIALVHCIRQCPVHDINNFSRHILGLPADCEAQLYPGATGSITHGPSPTDNNVGNRPTGSSENISNNDKEGQRTDDHGRHDRNDCGRTRDDNRNSTRYTSWSGSCTRTKDETGTMTKDSTATETGETIVVPMATDRAPNTPTYTGINAVTMTSNNTRTITVGPTSTVAGAATFGAPRIGFLVLGVVAWAFVL